MQEFHTVQIVIRVTNLIEKHHLSRTSSHTQNNTFLRIFQLYMIYVQYILEHPYQCVVAILAQMEEFHILQIVKNSIYLGLPHTLKATVC